MFSYKIKERIVVILEEETKPVLSILEDVLKIYQIELNVVNKDPLSKKGWWDTLVLTNAEAISGKAYGSERKRLPSDTVKIDSFGHELLSDFSFNIKNLSKLQGNTSQKIVASDTNIENKF